MRILMSQADHDHAGGLVVGHFQQHRKILVNIRLDIPSAASLEQLSWAVTVASRPGDSVIALHLLHDSDSEIRSMEKQYERARAGVLALLEQCRELCHFRQVTADVRIVPVINADHQKLKVVLEQATLLGSTTLVLCSSDVPSHSKLTGFTVRQATAPSSCLIFVAEENEMNITSKNPSIISPSSLLRQEDEIHTESAERLLSQKPSECEIFSRLSLLHQENKKDDESAQRLLPQKPTDCHFVQPAFELIRDGVLAANDYSPRGVLEGPDAGSSPDIGSSSPSFCTKPFLSDAAAAAAAGNDQAAEEDETDDEVEFQASCLNLFKHMKRQNTFPTVTSSSSSSSSARYRQRKLIPSFSCSSAQSGMRFSTDINDLQSICAAEDKPSSWRCFTYDELLRSTNCFHSDNFVGMGGYAVVYKGRLPDGQLIAVKKLTKGDSEQHKEGGFLTELGIIGHVSHPNTTSLIGFCVERGLHLVFPFSPNGSLASFLHGPKAKTLGWPLRHQIAVGTAKGLHYLHKLCPRRIIHRDIKASNILLGKDFEPQISDFGLAKWLPEQWTHHTVTPIEGTFGYLAPEYFMHGIVDEKTDVFAFGVLLLELITGRKPIDAVQGNLIVWARPYLEACDIQELVDPKLNGVYDASQLRRLILTAVLCVRQSPLWRPCMNQVVKFVTDETLDEEIPNNWSTLVCSSRDDDEYTSNEYNTDMRRHRALALGTSS